MTQFKCTMGLPCPYRLCLGDNCEYHKKAYTAKSKKRMDQFEDRKYCSSKLCDSAICIGSKCDHYIKFEGRE